MSQNHIYRLVWNEALGCWVAVAEFARGRGKSGGKLKRIALLAPLLPAYALAQTATPVVGSGATAYQAANGATVVNIGTANGAGLSHNLFTTYNVNAQGLVLNNGDTTQALRQSQLAGAVAANTHLASSAKVILNEVVSTNRSVLAGYTEVLGGRADVVVANPNGVTCSGCNFLNTDHVTLTTGQPIVGASGALSGFNVRDGDVWVNGDGYQSNAQQTLDLVARSIKVDAPIQLTSAGEVQLTAGTNTWNYGSRTVTASLSSGTTAPSYAIDTSALGGMYAGRIRVIATEAGVGVRMQGDALASADDFTLSASGKILIQSKLSAARNMAITSTGTDSAISLDHAGLSTGGDLSLNSAADVSLLASTANVGKALTLTATGNVNVQAGNDVVTTHTSTTDTSVSSNVASVVKVSGAASITSGQDVTFTGSNLNVGGDLDVKANNLYVLNGVNTSNSTSVTNLDTYFSTASAADASGQTTTTSSASGVVPSLPSTTGVLDIAKAILNSTLSGQATGGTVGSGQANASFQLNAYEGQATKSTSTTSTNVASSVAAGGNMNLTTTKDIKVQGSDVSSAGLLSVAAANVQVLAGSNQTSQQTQSSDVKLGLIGSFSVSGSFDANGNASASGGLANAALAQATSSGNVFTDLVTVTNSLLSTKANGSANLSANFIATGAANGELSVLTAHTVVHSDSSVSSVASNLSGGTLNVQSANAITVQGSNVQSTGALSLKSSTLTVSTGTNQTNSRTTDSVTKIGLFGDATATVKTSAIADIAAAASLGSASTVSALASGSTGVDANVSAATNLTFGLRNTTQDVQSSTSTVASSVIKSGNDLNLSVAKDALLTAAKVQSGGAMTITAGNVISTTAQNTSQKSWRNSYASLGLIDIQGAAIASASANASTNTSTNIDASALLTTPTNIASVGATANASASAGASVNLSVGPRIVYQDTSGSTGSLSNAASSYQSGGSFTRTASGTIADQGTQIASGADITQRANILKETVMADKTWSTTASQKYDAKIGLYAEAGASASASAGAGASVTTSSTSIQAPTASAGATATASAGVMTAISFNASERNAKTSKDVTSGYTAAGNINSTTTDSTTLVGAQMAAGKNVSVLAKTLNYQAANLSQSDTLLAHQGSLALKLELANLLQVVSAGFVPVGVQASAAYAPSVTSKITTTANVGTVVTGGDLTIRTSGDAIFAGTSITAANKANISSSAGGVYLNTATNTALDLAGSASATAGLDVGSISVGTSLPLALGGSVALSVDGAITNTAVSVKTGGDLSVSGAGVVSLVGAQLVSQGNASVRSDGLLLMLDALDVYGGLSLGASAGVNLGFTAGSSSVVASTPSFSLDKSKLHLKTSGTSTLIQAKGDVNVGSFIYVSQGTQLVAGGDSALSGLGIDIPKIDIGLSL